MIKITNLYKRYDDLEVLKGIDLEVPKGEVLSVIGSSGSGKSTLLYCINGLEPIQKGQIIVDDIDVHASNTNLNSVRQNMGMVFQQWNSFPHLTVLENVALAPKIVSKLSKSEALEVAEKQLLHVGLGDKLSQYPSALSGGQQQRLALARALYGYPDILILDEATSSLDTVSEKLIQTALEELHDDRTILVIAHRLSTIANADQILVLVDGKIVEQGKKSDLLSQGGTFTELWNLQR